MRLKVVKSKNVTLYYVIKSVYIDGKEKTITVEKLGNENEVIKKANGLDPIVWAKKYIAELNKQESENNRTVLIPRNQRKIINKDETSLFNSGYLFLEKIYYELGINDICKQISEKYKFDFDLNNILSRLLYCRILFPSSKLATNKQARQFIEQPNFDLHQIYRALDIIALEKDFIESQIYKNSLKIQKRNTSVLYYDCTNFFFEIEDEDGLKQYGHSKENRPNPIVQMGLFMDADGIPLAFNINPGNTNEQVTLTPTEKQIMKDFELSKFVVCTDAGLASNANRKFNNSNNRAFITTQSIKKLKSYLKDWALSDDDWILDGKKYTISQITKDEESIEKYFNSVFYKERWINENGLEQRLVVSFSLKYKYYQENIRNSQIQRAEKLINAGDKKINRVNSNDARRFIKKTSCTKDNEVATKNIYTIDSSVIDKEKQFDGFYAVCTNLEDDVNDIININRKRWEIEESFRIMKSEFKSRPVYLQKDNRIISHFTTCYLSLIIYRLLEKKLEEKYTCSDLINTLRNMQLLKCSDEGYIPAYTRTNLTDDLHEIFNFRTDKEIIMNNNFRKIIKDIKKRS